jgi:hypothetical protein
MVFKMAGTPADEFIFAATEAGPYVYASETDQWYALAGDVAPDQRYWALEYIDAMKTARFATYGRGAWDFRLTTPLGVNSPEKPSFTVYPNPCKDFIQVQKQGEDEVDYTLFSFDGKRLAGGRVKGSQIQISLGNVVSGVYLLMLEQKGKRSAERIIVTR